MKEFFEMFMQALRKLGNMPVTVKYNFNRPERMTVKEALKTFCCSLLFVFILAIIICILINLYDWLFGH